MRDDPETGQSHAREGAIAQDYDGGAASPGGVRLHPGPQGAGRHAFLAADVDSALGGRQEPLHEGGRRPIRERLLQSAVRFPESEGPEGAVLLPACGRHQNPDLGPRHVWEKTPPVAQSDRLEVHQGPHGKLLEGSGSSGQGGHQGAVLAPHVLGQKKGPHCQDEAGASRQVRRQDHLRAGAIPQVHRAEQAHDWHHGRFGDVGGNAHPGRVERVSREEALRGSLRGGPVDHEGLVRVHRHGPRRLPSRGENGAESQLRRLQALRGVWAADDASLGLYHRGPRESAQDQHRAHRDALGRAAEPPSRILPDFKEPTGGC
mmetsp:Transcript_52050/g.132188  ORF Transcript_52050/g.132188 Transcript_52050/m.132188 type:complete len:318 (-) Transcript_52050:154-1107(-)